MQIGNKLRNLRRIKNLTQEELAERTDLSKGYISQIEVSMLLLAWKPFKYSRGVRYSPSDF